MKQDNNSASLIVRNKLYISNGALNSYLTLSKYPVNFIFTFDDEEIFAQYLILELLLEHKVTPPPKKKWKVGKQDQQTFSAFLFSSEPCTDFTEANTNKGTPFFLSPTHPVVKEQVGMPAAKKWKE